MFELCPCFQLPRCNPWDRYFIFFYCLAGVGIVLITVSGIAWRLTATDAPSCRALLGIGGPYEEDYTHGGRFLSRPPMGYNGPYSGGGGGGGGGNTGGMGGQAPASAAGRAQHPYAGSCIYCRPHNSLPNNV